MMGNSLEPLRIRKARKHAGVAKAFDDGFIPRLANPTGLLGRGFGSITQSQSLPYLFAVPSRTHNGLRVVQHLPAGMAGAEGGLRLGQSPNGERDVYIGLKDLTSHLLIAGRTGSGKTLLARRLLRSAKDRDEPIPFVFLDLAQSITPEDWEFSDDPLLYEAGREFETGPFPSLGLLDYCVPGEYDNHVWLVADLLSNWLPSDGPLPLLLTELIHKSFEGITERDTGYFLAGEAEVRPLDELEQFIDKVFEEAGSGQRYEGELRGNLRGALLTRIRRLASPGLKPVLSGTSTDMYNALSQKRDFVMSLARSGSTTERCLIALVVLIKLRQWLRNTRDLEAGRAKLDCPRLLIVLDEAHILLRKSAERDRGGQSNIHAYAVRIFDELLAEIRQLGAAVIILDQSPGLLAESVLFSTANKVIFPLASGVDMSAVGTSMSIPERGWPALGTLPDGLAYLRTASNPDLTLVRQPEVGRKA
jgi:DNA helicase HerA-like ATPase